MNLNELRRLNNSNTSDQYRLLSLMKKPIEIYFFLDPLCSECWSLEPYLKKLLIEYGRFLTIRPIISTHLTIISKQKVNNPLQERLKDRSFQATNKQMDEHTKISNHSITMAIKAAELQGKNAGITFLRKIQENFFIKRLDVSKRSILLKCAIDANLDVEEFIKDLNSVSAKKASQCDLKITKEMKVNDAPTIVFFNQLVEEDGVKISGLNSYDIYVLILSEMLQRKPIPAIKPPLEDYLAYYNVVSNKEISIVYDLTLEEAKLEMIKLQLKQKAQKKIVQNEVFWKYTFKSKP